MNEIKQIEKLFWEVMQGKIIPLDLSPETISRLTQEVINPTKNLRLVK